MNKLDKIDNMPKLKDEQLLNMAKLAADFPQEKSFASKLKSFVAENSIAIAVPTFAAVAAVLILSTPVEEEGATLDELLLEMDILYLEEMI